MNPRNSKSTDSYYIITNAFYHFGLPLADIKLFITFHKLSISLNTLFCQYKHNIVFDDLYSILN